MGHAVCLRQVGDGVIDGHPAAVEGGVACDASTVLVGQEPVRTRGALAADGNGGLGARCRRQHYGRVLETGRPHRIPASSHSAVPRVQK